MPTRWSKVEDTEHTPESVRVFKSRVRGANIRPQGEDVKQGDCIIPKGTRIRSGEGWDVGHFSQVLCARVSAAAVAILSTGDGWPIWMSGSAKKIINSNSYGIAAAVQEAGGVPILLGIAQDTLPH